MAKINRFLPPELEELLISQNTIFGDMFLVGGAIRNSLLKKTVQDFDLVVKEGSIRLAKKIADQFHGDFYVMDKERETARVIIYLKSEMIKIDIALIVGDSINSDLSKRDFTFNAIACRSPFLGDLIDPLNGITDVFEANLKICSPTSLEDDPVRVIRAVRFINEFDLSYKSIPIGKLKKAASRLNIVSNERKRDEIVNILEKTNINKSLYLLRDFGILKEIFPDVVILDQVKLDSLYVHGAWEHTCQTAAYCQQLTDIFNETIEISDVHPRIQQAFEALKRYQKKVKSALNDSISSGRSKRILLFLACIYHDAGKATIEPLETSQKNSVWEHAKAGSYLIINRAMTMGFSKNEIEFMANIVEFHIKPSEHVFLDPNEKDIHIYRFFKKAGPAGVMVSLLYLSDVLAAYEETLPDDRWDQAIAAVFNIYEAYFARYEKIIDPPKLIDGVDLITTFDLEPGKEIGRLLESVVEAQVENKVQTKEQAIEFTSNLLFKNQNLENK